MVNFTFSRELRLLTPNQFTFVFQKPERVSTLYFTSLGRLNMLKYPRIGLTIAKKHVKQAHERNRIKRLIRESFRLHQQALPAMDFVVIAKKDVANIDNYILIKILEKLWRHYHHFLCY